MIYIVLCITENLMVGSLEAIDKVMEALPKNGLVLKMMEGLWGYFYYDVWLSLDKRWLGKDSSTSPKNWRRNSVIEWKEWNHKMPGILKLFIARSGEDSEKNSAEDQNVFQSRVRMLLYLTKHSISPIWPKTIKNKWWCEPSSIPWIVIHYQVCAWCKIFNLNSGTLGNTSKPQNTMCLSNSNYVKDPISRQRISGFVLYILGVTVYWQSKT